MKKHFTTLLISLLITLSVTAKKYHVYYLGGQSNMDGYGKISELPDSLNKTFNSIPIFHGNTSKDGEDVDGKGIWTKLKPGHGRNFISDGKNNQYSDRFGIELTFAYCLQEMNPEENIALIKYSRGGTSISIDARRFGCWDPDYSEGNGVNQWDHYLATIGNAWSIKDIDGDGEEDELIPSGIIWMQGESDALAYNVAIQYESNLKRLMDLIRASLLVDDLPVIIGRISDSGQDETDGHVLDFANVVKAAQENFVKKDSNAGIVLTTENYGFTDKWHFDTNGFIDLGKQFAIEMNKLK